MKKRLLRMAVCCILGIAAFGGIGASSAAADGGPYYGTYQITDGAGNANQFAIYWDSKCTNGTWGIEHRWYTGTAWTPWYEFTGCGFSGIDVGLNLNGSLEIFIVGGNYSMWHRWQICAGCPWSAWYNMGGGFLVPGCHATDCVGWTPTGYDQGSYYPQVFSTLSGWTNLGVFDYGWDYQRWVDTQCPSCPDGWGGWHHG